MSADQSPIFVIGTGRCGLTPLMDLICYHKALAWPSQYLNRPYTASKYYLAALSRIANHWPSFLPGKHDSKWIPRHSEAFHLWASCFKGFSRPFRDLTGEDVTQSIEEKFKHTFQKIIQFQGKERIIAEYSGWSRIPFFKKMFPDAKFIHVVRDGRAVANSFLNVDYWGGWEGVYKWRWGLPSPALMDQFEKHGKSFVALAGIQWKMLIESCRQNLSKLDPNDYREVRYEDMVQAPEATALQCLDFLGLDPECKIFKKNLSQVKIIDANNAPFRISPWKRNLSPIQINMLNDILDKELRHYGYDI